ncbi:uncharacterized protein LTHEOB_2207 [Lasiodiplodia theobromae]|uniref:uncharacterized protein n=1 Tax=Lasiodiplodia theobromae TaxID=45133 RepID=UPI0015C3A615|nr:uncharacterized protein LTHEOB_2207 [Lasiodiplodia theobromae]KAF4536446.1 hypothetical protein LTHEOB_2207 [Lasiodiplodia theobromae]
MSHTNATPTSGGEPRKEVLSLAARPLFASQGSSSSLLFVDETAPKNQVERRKIRAHVSLNTHEAKRRQGLRGQREGVRRRSSGENATVENPLLDAPFANADPFDSLPVKKFPGMHDLIGYYLDHYPGVTPFADDQLLRNQSTKVVAKRSNTQWNLITSHNTCLLLFLSEILRLRCSMNPYPKWLTDYFRAHHQTLISIRENLPIHNAANKPSSGYIFGVLGMGSGQAVFLNHRDSAISHLNGARKLVSLRGGMDTVHGFARRVIVWAELYVCAAFGLQPTLAPLPSPWLPLVTTTSPSPFPASFSTFISATHARTAAHLTPHPLGKNRQSAGEDDEDAAQTHKRSKEMTISRIFSALTLVSAATTEAWQAVLQQQQLGGESSGGSSDDTKTTTMRETVAAVLDDAAHTLLVEVARLRDNDDGVGEDGGGEEVVVPVVMEQQHGPRRWGSDDGGDGEDDAARRWARAVMLHAAHTYLWAQLSALPAHAQMNVTLLKRLRGAIESGAGVGAWVLSLEALMWALAVGWFMAERAAGKTLLGQVGEADPMLGWFEDRILALLNVEGSFRKDRAAEMISDFPATDEFRRKWHSLLLRDKFRQWR